MKNNKPIQNLKSSFGKLKDDDFNFDLISDYFSNKDNSDSLQVLSERTCNDLDFEELFMFLDRTTSKPGQQYLYNKLRLIPEANKNSDYKEELIQKFIDDEDFRIEVQLKLNKLNKTEAYYISSLFQEEHQKPPKWFSAAPLLSFASLLSLILIPFNRHMLFVFIGVFIANLLLHYINKQNLYQYLGSIPQLLKLNYIAKKLYKDENLSQINPELSPSFNELNKINKRASFFIVEAKLQGELASLFWFILELFKIAFLLEPILLFSVLKRFHTKRKEINEIFNFIGEIDVLISIASLRKGLDYYCIPEISNAEIDASKIYHPLILNCVSNSINVNDKSVLITGSNMSGKTSFIRTIGINVICGLTINTCFAKSISFPRIKVFSAIRINDDLLNDKSYYFEEVLTIKQMLKNSYSGKANLFLLDEIFKGTNTVERISAGKAVLSKLAKNNNFVFVSTHDVELTEMLADEYELYHFSEIVKDNNVDFDYKLKAGKLQNRNAIRILQINNYPEDVVNEAKVISNYLDNLSIL